MRLEFISPFVHSAHSVLETLLGAAPTRGEPSLQGKGFHVSEVLAMVGVVGDIEGTVICSMTRTVALGISGRMLGGARLRELGDLGRSAISVSYTHLDVYKRQDQAQVRRLGHRADQSRWSRRRWYRGARPGVGAGGLR